MVMLIYAISLRKVQMDMREVKNNMTDITRQMLPDVMWNGIVALLQFCNYNVITIESIADCNYNREYCRLFVIYSLFRACLCSGKSK